MNEQSIDLATLLSARPIRYLTTKQKPGLIERPFPNAILVIIALNRLTHANGLPRQHPPQEMVLQPGQDLSLSGDDPRRSMVKEVVSHICWC